MNRGEKSCRRIERCAIVKNSIGSCNVDCVFYKWDGETAPISTTRADRQAQLEYKRMLVKEQLAACTHKGERVNGMCADCGRLMKGSKG